MKIFTLIPAYNEKENLVKLIGQLENEFKKQKIQFKIFFVIQGNDKSKELLENLKKKNSCLDFVYYPKPLGIGNAYKIGYAKADKSADYILTMDADLNHDIRDLSRFIKAMNDTQSDIIIGSRFITGGKFGDKRIWKRMASRLMNKLITASLNINIKDISSGYRLIKRGTAERVSNKLRSRGYPSYMEFIVLAHKLKMKMTEIPITYHHRVWGKSKISSVQTLIDYFRFLGTFIFSS